MGVNLYSLIGVIVNQEAFATIRAMGWKRYWLVPFASWNMESAFTVTFSTWRDII